MRGGNEGAKGAANGAASPPTTVVLRMTEEEQEFVFEHVSAEPVRGEVERGFFLCVCVWCVLNGWRSTIGVWV